MCHGGAGGVTKFVMVRWVGWQSLPWWGGWGDKVVMVESNAQLRWKPLNRDNGPPDDAEALSISATRISVSLPLEHASCGAQC